MIEKQTKQYKHQKLGLDIGTKSLGWAIIGQDASNEKWEFVDFGVRIWDSPEDRHLKTDASKRRIARSSRRIIRRKQNRVKDIKKEFVNLGLITDFEIQDHFDKLREKSDYNVTNEKWKDQINPLNLRYKGLSEKLTPLQLVIISINYAKRRGYENKFELEDNEKDSKEKEDKQKVQKQKTETQDKHSDSISDASGFIKEYTFPINAIMNHPFFQTDNREKNENNVFYRNRKPKPISISDAKNNPKSYDFQNNLDKNKGRKQILFLTKDNKNEFKHILQNQQQYYDEINIEKLNEIVELVFRKRDFEDGPGPKKEEIKQIWKNSFKNNKSPNISLANRYKSFLELVGKCQFYPNEKRENSYSIFGDLWTIQTHLSNLLSKKELSNQTKSKKPLSDQEVIDKIKKISEQIFNHYFKNLSYKKQDLKKIFEANDLDFDLFEIALNSNPRSGTNLTFDKFHNKLFLVSLFSKTKTKDKIFSSWLKIQSSEIDFKNFDSIKESSLNKLGNVLYSFKTPDKLIQEIMKLKIDGLDSRESINIWLKAFKQKLPISRVYSVCNKHIFKSLEFLLIEGKTYSVYQVELLEKQKLAFRKDLEHQKVKDYLLPLKDADMIRNAVVYRSINQTRRVLKEILKRFGFIENIVIEVAGELYNEKTKREEISKRNENNLKDREKARNLIRNFDAIPNETNIERYRLFENQKINKNDTRAIDFYSLVNNKTNVLTDENFIELRDIFKDDLYEIDHIIPISKSQDDSFKNKVITRKTFNQLKGQRTPHQWISNFGRNIDNWDNFNKKLEFLKIPKIFPTIYINLAAIKDSKKSFLENQTRQLNDTRYITSYISKYLEQEMEKYKKIFSLQRAPIIVTINGNTTSYLRRYWLNSTPWGFEEKPRKFTPFHHAVDAMILANLHDKYNIFVSQSILRMRRFYTKEFNKLEKINFNNLQVNNSIEAFEAFKNELLRFFDISTRYIKNNENDVAGEYQVLDREKYKNELEKAFNHLIESFKNKNFIKFHEDIIINNIVESDVKNLKNIVSNLIPIELEFVSKKTLITKQPKNSNFDLDLIGNIEEYNVEIKEPASRKKSEEELEFVRIIPKDEWSALNNKNDKEYPYISYKVDRKISGNFANENPTSIKAIKETYMSKNNLNSTKEISHQDLISNYRYVFKNGNYFKTESYLGINYEKETKSFHKYSMFEAKTRYFKNKYF